MPRFFSGGQNGSPVSPVCLRRMQCDNKPMMWRNPLDFAGTVSGPRSAFPRSPLMADLASHSQSGTQRAHWAVVGNRDVAGQGQE
jgi:hypothetical protein